jgi:hypothetical protein
MEYYKHTQIGWPVLIILTTIALLLLFYSSPPNWIGATIVIFGALVYGSISIRVTEKNIYCSFGIGLRKKSFDVRSIKNINKCKISLLYGLGERYLGKDNEIYNVSGQNGVELIFENNHRIRIATNDGSRLVECLKDIKGQQVNGNNI